ncbi:MAG: TetR/AcrR family transcriptional regulator [Anaerolineae bacterium]|jgi:AcrR family transcriptional regulator|nr:TetR/AcrR family transcriptional regulator [Anaerolineae bacterium]MCZ7552966.1 TetR/AcrR family transcriptional regulator [Anaerolineales bacterium]
MEKIDRRIKRTQRLLQQALISLTLEKGFDAVTIREITERADVGYATFFRHYPDKDALLADVLDSMRQEFRDLLMPHSIITEPETMGELLFEYVQENADLCRVLLNSTNTMTLLRPVQEIGQQEIGWMFPGGDARPIPLDVSASHLMTSLVMLIRWWLENNMPYSPQEMGRIAAKLIISPVIESLRG